MWYPPFFNDGRKKKMSQINLNPTPKLAPVIPKAPASSGMSPIAKVVMVLAAVFFATYVFIAISKFGKNGGTKKPPEEDQEISKIQQALGKFFDNVPPGHSAEYGRVYAKFTGSCKITPDDIEAANALIGKLQARPTETADQRTALREEQDREYQVALEKDRMASIQRERLVLMTDSLTGLQAEIFLALEALNARFTDLEKLEQCWGRLCIFARNPQIGSFTKLFSDLEAHFKVETVKDLSVPKDQFSQKVESFYAQFPDEGKGYDEKRAALEESYQGYCDVIMRVQERLLWTRLKAYHAEVGEDFFASHFSIELLTQMRRGEALPAPSMSL